MTEGLKWTVNEVPKSDDAYLELMSEANVKSKRISQEFSAVYSDSSAEAFRPGKIPGCKKYLLQG